MTTKQTIDGVPRKLLNNLLAWLERANERNDDGDIAEYVELRALLDAPYPSEAQLIAAGFGYPMSKEDAVKAYKASLLPRTDNPSNADCEWCHGCGHDPYGEPCVGCCTPAAQPQGEPAAWKVEVDGMTLHHREPMKHPRAKNTPLYEQPAPVAVVPIQEDRETLIGYGRSSGLDEASTLCARLAYAAYYPPGTRFKAFTPKAQKALGDLLIKAANDIASLPGGPYERFKARQAKKAESAKT